MNFSGKNNVFYILLCLFLSGFGQDVSAQVVNGEINLYRVDFPGTIALDGEWEFYWEKLYQPRQIPVQKNYMLFPSLWNNYKSEGITSTGYATYHLTLYFPKEKLDYALFVDDMYTAYRLFLNDKEIANNGIVAKERDSYQPKWVPQVVPLKDLSGKVTLTLQIANFQHAKGGITKSLVLGDYETILNQFNTRKLLDIILTSFFIFLGLFFFIRFSLTLSGWESFYFSMFCLAFSYQIIGAEFYVLHQWIENYPWEMGIRLEYLAIFVSSTFFGLYLKNLYPTEVGKYPIMIFLIVNIVYILFTLLTSTTFFTGIISPYLIFLLFYFFYAFTVFISAMGKKIKGAEMGVLSSSVLFMSMSYSILEYLSVVPKWDALTFFGYGLFMFFQTLLLFQHETKLELSGS